MSWFYNDVYELSYIAILNIKGSDYCCIIGGFHKNDAMIVLENIDLTEESGRLENIKLYYHK